MKELKINGFNVSECSSLCSDTICFLASFTEPKENQHCENNPQCYFKQLQRKKAECKQLKKDVEEWHIKYAGCNTANSGIIEANKQLQNELETLNQAYKNCVDKYELIKEESNEIKEDNKALKKEIENYKKFMTQFENLLDVLEACSTKISDINRFKNEVNKDKWEYLTIHYFEPLIYEYEKISDAYCNLEDV